MSATPLRIWGLICSNNCGIGAGEEVTPGNRELEGRKKGESDSKISLRKSLSARIEDRSDSKREVSSISNSKSCVVEFSVRKGSLRTRSVNELSIELSAVPGS